MLLSRHKHWYKIYISLVVEVTLNLVSHEISNDIFSAITVQIPVSEICGSQTSPTVVFIFSPRVPYGSLMVFVRISDLMNLLKRIKLYVHSHETMHGPNHNTLQDWTV
jgi:hypothetical protein